MWDFFSLDYRMSHGNLHIELRGYFDYKAAKQVLSFLGTYYKNTGRIFLNTVNLDHISESGVMYFKEHFAFCHIPTSCLFIKGEHGFRLGLTDSQVLVANEHKKEKKCSGNCKNCQCGHEKNTHTRKSESLSRALTAKMPA